MDLVVCFVIVCFKDGRGERRGSLGRVRIGLGFGGLGVMLFSVFVRFFEGDFDVLGW